jgi:p-cumate 2,3-dioxygenase beta subunit
MSTDLLLRLELEEFLVHEAALLDGWDLAGWQALLTEDAAYYVPPNDRPDGDHRTTLFLVADDIVRLRERLIRLADPNCHSEFPPSRTRRMIGNLRILAVNGGEVRTECNFITHRFRRGGDVRCFVGRHRHTLRRGATGWLIAERWAILDAEELGALGSISFLL